MKKFKIFVLIIFFISSNYLIALAGVTQSTPSNIIQRIASSSSFTSTATNNPQAALQIQNTTNTIVNAEQLIETVQQDAEKFGLRINQAALGNLIGESNSEGDKEEKFVNVNDDGPPENPEPTLDTIVYDTGLITLTREGGNYQNDSGNLFSSSKPQQARVKVYVDFKRKLLWGDVESRINLTAVEDTMTNNYKGTPANITELPVDKVLNYTVSSSTSLPLELPTSTNPSATGKDLEPYYYQKNTNAFLNSLLDENGNLSTYLPASQGGAPDEDLADMVKNVGHGTDADANVYVGARFLTAGSGTPGKTTASFEISTVGPCADPTECTDGSGGGTNEKTAFKNSIIRYSKTVETKASKFTGD